MPVLLVLMSLGALLALAWSRGASAGALSSSATWWGDDEGGATGGFVVPDIPGAVSLWDGSGAFDTVKFFELPPAAEAYRDAIARAEERHSLPPSLLGRVLWQESRFRPDVIDGTTRSSAGAMGIAQFMPDTAREFGIDPLQPDQAIDAAGRYLRRLFEQFGDWRSAVAAYNWGPANWRAFQETGRGARGQVRPAENINYLSAILADVGV